MNSGIGLLVLLSYLVIVQRCTVCWLNHFITECCNIDVTMCVYQSAVKMVLILELL